MDTLMSKECGQLSPSHISNYVNLFLIACKCVRTKPATSESLEKEFDIVNKVYLIRVMKTNLNIKQTKIMSKTIILGNMLK